MWRSWAEERGINPNLEENSAEILNSILQQFYAEVRNKRGESYEPESLKGMMASLDRYLRERNYSHSIIKDRQFQQSKKVLEGQAKLLRQEGKGKRPNASSALSIPEEEALWENGKLGSSSPRVLCHIMWFDSHAALRIKGTPRTPLHERGRFQPLQRRPRHWVCYFQGKPDKDETRWS